MPFKCPSTIFVLSVLFPQRCPLNPPPHICPSVFCDSLPSYEKTKALSPEQGPLEATSIRRFSHLRSRLISQRFKYVRPSVPQTGRRWDVVQLTLHSDISRAFRCVTENCIWKRNEEVICQCIPWAKTVNSVAAINDILKVCLSSERAKNGVQGVRRRVFRKPGRLPPGNRTYFNDVAPALYM